MMADLPLITYEFLISLIPLVAVAAAYGHRQKKQGFPISGFNFCMLLVLGLYCIGVLYVTGAGTLWSGLRFGPDFRSVNLIPFSRQIDAEAYFLNLVMGIPLGFLLPLMYSHQDRVLKIMGTGALLFLLVELSQIFSFRAADVDDLILNTLGTAVGYGLFRLTAMALKGKKPPRKLPSSGLYLIPAAVFLSHFFLYDQLGFLRLIHPGS